MSECKWTPVTKRWPAEEDGDETGDVIFIWQNTQGGISTAIAQHSDRSWSRHCRNLRWAKLPNFSERSQTEDSKTDNK